METRRLTVLALLGLLILLSGRSLSGQRIGDVGKGERVRITYDSSGPRVVVGLLHDVLDDAFLVSPTGNRVVPIPRDQVTDFRVLRGQEREWKKGLLVGAPVGALVGVLMYALLEESVEESVEGAFGFGVEAESSSPGTLAYGAVGALYGGGIGAGIGLFFKKDRWDPVVFRTPLPRSRSFPAERFSLGFAIPLGE